MDFGKYIEMIDWLLKKTLLNPEVKLEGLDDNQIDDVGSEIYNHFKNSSKKKDQKVRIITWFNYFGYPDSSFPILENQEQSYYAYSPTLGKKILYNEEEIWNEVDRICAMDPTGKFTPGNNLYVYLPHFCNPQYFYDYDLVSYLEEFYFIKSFNIPLTQDLQNENYDRLVIFRTIDREQTQCEIYKSKKTMAQTVKN